jgi:glycosyltransferase involved in cell wall biosynthesis
MHVLAWPAGSDVDNPYTRLLYDALRRVDPTIEVHEFAPSRLVRDRFDIWHLHWPERPATKRPVARAVANVLAFAGLVVLAKLRRVRVIWTVHNLQSHERVSPRLERALLRWFSRRVDGSISLTTSGRAIAAKQFPALSGVPSAVVPHGHFLDAYPNTVSRAEARGRLGLSDEALVVGYVGRISPHKNVGDLLAAFASCTHPRAVLLVAGAPATPELSQALEAAARQDTRVQLHLRSIADNEIQLFMNASDLVVYPYRDIFKSSSVFLGLSFGRPVLAPAAGALPELADAVPKRWLTLYSGKLSADDVTTALERLPERPAEAASLVQALRRNFDWESSGSSMARLYRTLIEESA